MIEQESYKGDRKASHVALRSSRGGNMSQIGEKYLKTGNADLQNNRHFMLKRSCIFVILTQIN